VFGALRGVVHTDAKFFEPLPVAELDAWEGDTPPRLAPLERSTDSTHGVFQPTPLAEATVVGRRWARRFLRRLKLWNREQVAALLRITPDAVRLRVRRGTLLAVDFEARRYFPAAQFDRRRRQLRSEVRTYFATTPARDRWVLTYALLLPVRGRRAKLMQLLEGHDHEAVLAIVRRLRAHAT
jgi:hypothetical protein